MNRFLLSAALSLLFLAGAANGQQRFDAADLLADVRYLASDELAGRRTGTEGGRMARDYVEQRFRDLGLEMFGRSYLQEFTFVNRRDGQQYTGYNVIGYVRGTAEPDVYTVITAHFDHLGERNGDIYNGADDNASGTAALMAFARYFREHPPVHSIIFAAVDAEEMGLQGARHFVANPPVLLDQIALNINMDMISRNDRDELYAAGTYHYPFLRPHLEQVAERSRINLLFGHDSPDLPPGEDWTMSSDHAAFHEAGIPFVYFGNEDHPGYHHPSDTYQNITPAFFIRAADTVLDAVLTLDGVLSEIRARPAASKSP
jgi:Zn-dependent M28 family amino/carboxypeptidase